MLGLKFEPRGGVAPIGRMGRHVLCGYASVGCEFEQRPIQGVCY